MLSRAEIAFRCHGLEVAGARSDTNRDRSTVLRRLSSAWAEDPAPRASNYERFTEPVRSQEVRHAEGPRTISCGGCI